MPTFIVQIAEVLNYEVEIEASNEGDARDAAFLKWRDADEVGGWQIPDTVARVVAVTAKR